MEGASGRPRFCAELGGDLGKIILDHVHLGLVRRICAGVCKGWRQLIGDARSVINVGSFLDLIRELDDEHMGCLRLWKGRLHRMLTGAEQLRLLRCAVRRDRPTALLWLLGHTNLLPSLDAKSILSSAVENDCRAVIEQVAVPLFFSTDKRPDCLVHMFTLAHHTLFRWFCETFPMVYVNPDKIKCNSPIADVDDKVCTIRDCVIKDRDWWTRWFTKAAGIRKSFVNLKGKKTWQDPEINGQRYYNAHVAVAIVEHVLLEVPAKALDYLTNAKLRINRERDDKLLERLRPFIPGLPPAKTEQKKKKPASVKRRKVAYKFKSSRALEDDNGQE